VAANELLILLKATGGPAVVAQLNSIKTAAESLGPAISAGMDAAAAAASAGADKIAAANTRAAESFKVVGTEAKTATAGIDAAMTPVAASVDKAAASMAKLGESAKAAGSEVTAGLGPLKATFDETAAAATGAAEKTAAAWTATKDKIVADAAEMKTALGSTALAQDGAAAAAGAAAAKTSSAANDAKTAVNTGSGEIVAADAAAGAAAVKSGGDAEKGGKLLKGSATDWAIGAGIMTVATDKVVMSGVEWDRQMHMLVNVAGELPKNLDMVSAGLKQIAMDTGTSTKDMAEGMYLVEKAGHQGADGLDVARRAAEMAKQENIPLGDSIKQVTTLMRDYPDRFKSAADATSFLVAVAGEGQMKMSELDRAMAAVMPKAAAMGVSVESVAASLDEMTRHGVPAQ